MYFHNRLFIYFEIHHLLYLVTKLFFTANDYSKVCIWYISLPFCLTLTSLRSSSCRVRFLIPGRRLSKKEVYLPFLLFIKRMTLFCLGVY